MPCLVLPTLLPLDLLRPTPGTRRCAGCGVPSDPAGAGDLAVKPEGGPQISRTRDGFILASPRFVERYQAEGWRGLEFRRLSCGYAVASASRAVRVKPSEAISADSTCAQCAKCGRPSPLTGGAGLQIARGEIPVGLSEFVAPDPGVGGRVAFLIAGDGIRAAHKARKLRGADMRAAVACESWQNVEAPGGMNCGRGDVVPFPRPARPPAVPRRIGATRDPRRPEDLKSWLRDMSGRPDDETDT